MKYYVTRTNKNTGVVQYKKNKTVDGWASENFKPYCWQFSKQGAKGIVERYRTYRNNGLYEYGIEAVGLTQAVQ